MDAAFEVGLYTFGDLTQTCDPARQLAPSNVWMRSLPQQSLLMRQVSMFLQLENITGWIWPSLRRPSC